MDVTPVREGRHTIEPLESFPVVGIGASAGGLESIIRLFQCLPHDTGMTFVVIQHLDRHHPSLLVELLSKVTAMPVLEGQDRLAVLPNHVYAIPAHADLTIENGILRLRSRPDPNQAHMPIDLFFQSLAKDRQNHAIGVVLSGTGSDGTEGLSALKIEGGVAFAQDPASAKFDGMPKAAIESGAVDFVLPPEEIAKELASISQHPLFKTSQDDLRHQDEDASFGDLLELLRASCGIDFAHYKRSTIKRRVNRRMGLQKFAEMRQYLAYLRAHDDEIRILYEDILIHVTQFFRDPDMFEALKREVYPAILEAKAKGEALRVWIAGCSTGEEAYSHAINLYEYLGDHVHDHPLQLFATDVSETALAKAREGRYPEEIAHDVSKERRDRFFTKGPQGYTISKFIREMCVFVRHDATKDPPFSRMDIISCRNLLIYLGPFLQERMFHAFHFGLSPDGFLVLGKSEGLGPFHQLFQAIDKRHKIFRKCAISAPLRFDFGAMASPDAHGSKRNVPAIKKGVDLAREADRILLARFTPVGVVVNASLDVLQFRGRTAPYLEPAPGHPTLNLMKMAHEGLLAPIRSAFNEARLTNGSIRMPHNPLREWDPVRYVDVEVIPFKPVAATDTYFIILFEEHPKPLSSHQGETTAAPGNETQELAQELTAAKEYLQSVIEEFEATNEDLTAANEEAVSANEELQSTNEELQTAKEELQSANEELNTINDELQNLNNELNLANNDLINLLSSVEIAIIMLGRDFRIRRFTPTAVQALNLIPSDVGRPISDIQPNINVPDLDAMIRKVVNTLQLEEREVQNRDGHWYRLQIRPYMTIDKKIDGAVLILVDINTLKHALDANRQVEAERSRLLVQEQAARTEAEQASRAKDFFLATLSHELRNPLNTILGWNHLLLEGQVSEQKSRHGLAMIDRSARQLTKLISDLIDLSTAVSGKLVLEIRPVDLNKAVQAAVETAQVAAEAKSTQLEVRLDPSVGFVLGDPGRIQQIFGNLLTNAIKFTPEKGRVQVRSEHLGDSVRVRVQDNGKGISPEFFPKLFEPFTQAAPFMTRQHGGLGLGLAIVKQLVELHGGTVAAESQGNDHGSVFSVTFPLSDESGDVAESLPFPANLSDIPDLEGVRVLFVDDDPAAREMIEEIFKRWGASVSTAESAEEAIARLETNRPDVLISDLAMPGEGGLFLMQKVRSRGAEEGGQIPAIALTAHAGREQERLSKDAGFQAHVAKPFQPLDLAHLILELLRRTPPSSG